MILRKKVLIVSAATVAGVMIVLNRTYGFVGEGALVAPQANAMAAVIQPLMEGGTTPWVLYFIGAVLALRKEGQKYPAELIPVRLSEIYLINEGYEWVVSTVKQELKKDFQGIEEDLEKLQQVIDSGKIGSKKKEEWLAIGITVCAILANEVDGMEWKTLIDGNREAPVLQYKDRTIDPMKLVWSKVKAGEPCNVIEEYKKCLD